jgi:hypothetical protein
MGEVISKNAAVDDIMADVAMTYARAKARGGKWLEHADRMLGNSLNLAESLVGRRRAALDEMLPLAAALDAQDEHADRFIGQISDEVWNLLGRPAFDPTYDVVFPNGINYYTGGPDDEQPDRMELLAELLEMNVISRISADQARAFAQRVRDEEAAYRKVLDQTAIPRARLQLLDRAKIALVQSAQIALAHLKRLYRAEGFSEAEIHTVIPDRPRKRASTLPPPAPAAVANPAQA